MENKRTNQANRVAKESIVGALVQLTKEKPLSVITISELTKRAGVSRMTFYRNYQSKEDIFANYLKELLEQYEEEDREMGLAGIYYDRAHLSHCFRFWYQHREFFEGLIRCGFGNIFLEYLTAYVTEKWQGTCKTDQQKYQLPAFAGALYNIYIVWASGGYQETVEELTDMLDMIYGTSLGKID